MEKKKFATRKQVIILSIIVIIVLAIIGYSQYNKHQKIVSFCKGACEYVPAQKAWNIPFYTAVGEKVKALKGESFTLYKYFETQKQCIDYCSSK